MCLCDDADEARIEEAIERMVAEMASFVPGYRLKQQVQFRRFTQAESLPRTEPVVLISHHVLFNSKKEVSAL